jgi:glycosyltransferase involved in cell wall biosynthesis
MTTSAESRAETSHIPLGFAWRAAAARAQAEVLPAGRVHVSCSAAPGAGGLGRHLQEILDALSRRGLDPTCSCGVAPASASGPGASRIRARTLGAALAIPARVSPSWRALRASVVFDARSAARLPAADHLIAFNGQALTQLHAARRRAYDSTALMSANAHMRSVVERHALAHRQYPLEPSWATRLLRRNLREYEQADRIYVSSLYARESFLAEGFAEERLPVFPLTPASRYQPDPRSRAEGTFDIVYVGGLSVAKGVPLLIDAVSRLAYPDLRLRLVGGPQTRGMRRYLRRACAADSRVAVLPGDPLPHLLSSRLLVHATYSDGFGYAPAEAIACGLPAIVSEDTGMKELIEPGGSGLVLPTGDLAALTEAIDCVYRGEILSV